MFLMDPSLLLLKIWELALEGKSPQGFSSA